MALDQLPGRMREFVAYLDGVLARLDQGAGWCAVFWQRDPDGMQACLDGREVPPWDVVEALLQDLAAEYGAEAAHAEAERARPLHAAAQAAHDARPGGRDALGDRFDVMLREQRYAAERQAELGRRLATATTQEEADAVRLDLAWARDDHERAVRRCAELQSRMAELDRRTLGDQARAIRRGRVAQDGVFRGAFGGGEAGFGGGGREAGDSGDGPEGGAGGTGGSRGLGGGYGDGFVGAGEDAARGAGGGRSPGGYGSGAVGGGAVGGGGQTASGTWGGGREPGGHGHGHESGARAADGRSAEFPDMPQQRGATSARDAEAPHAGQGPAPAWTDAHGPAPRGPGAGAAGPGPAPQPPTPAWADAPGRAPQHPGPTDPTPPTAPPPGAKRKRWRGGARFAGVGEAGGAPVAVPPAAAPGLPTAPVAKGRTPRGARFAGAAQAPEASPRQGAEPSDVVARRETAETVAALVRLRSQGRTGEAHAVLVEVAHWPADRFPLLAAELQQAGLGADWATLLWEAASLPADRLVAAADALVAAGRDTDGQQILRQGVARPAGEIGAAVLALVAEGRRREVTALLDAYVRVRTPEEAARSAEPGPATLVPLLLAAARGVSDERHWDLVHALRVAGFSA